MQGAGGSGVTSGIYLIFAFSVDPSNVVAYTDFFGTAFEVASAAGLLLGGILINRLSWRWC